MFAGHNAYRFADDPWYKDGFVPTREAAGGTDPDRILAPYLGAVEKRGRLGEILPHEWPMMLSSLLLHLNEFSIGWGRDLEVNLLGLVGCIYF